MALNSVRVMKREGYRREEVVELLLQGIERVKREILDAKRSEDDYPVGIRAAAELLSGLLGHITDGRSVPTGKRSKADRTLKTSLELILKAEKWDSQKVFRKRYKNGPSFSYKFFLPGDEHYAHRPRTDREHVRLLFNLERKWRSESEDDDGDVTAASLPLDLEAFEARVRSAYHDLVGKTRGAVYVRIPELRKALGVAEDLFQQGLLAMRDKGEVVLSKHGYAAGLSQEDRDASIRISPGEYYYYVTLREEL